MVCDLPVWKSALSLKRCATESMTTRRKGGPGGFWMKCSMRRSRSSRSSHVAMSRSTYMLSKASPDPQYLQCAAQSGVITTWHVDTLQNFAGQTSRRRMQRSGSPLVSVCTPWRKSFHASGWVKCRKHHYNSSHRNGQRKLRCPYMLGRTAASSSRRFIGGSPSV